MAPHKGRSLAATHKQGIFSVPGSLRAGSAGAGSELGPKTAGAEPLCRQGVFDAQRWEESEDRYRPIPVTGSSDLSVWLTREAEFERHGSAVVVHTLP